ncbi:MAG: ATP-dependent RNA helicase DbpA [Bacteriovoracia bacterium]
MGKVRFDSLPLPEEVLTVIQELGFTELTPIQAESIPLLLEGKDLIGQSKTGSGKTFAFALPILARLPDSEGELQALVLCPTRELCTQVTREIRRLGRRFQGLNVASLVGGQPIQSQLGALRMGAHIAVGTPGRVLDHLRRGTVDLSRCTQIALDEADRMLDMGFQEEMEEILAALPEERQTIFFSATFPDSIEAMSERYQKSPARIIIQDEASGAASSIEQILYEVEEQNKLPSLLHCLRERKPEQAIIFCNLKVTVVELTKILNQSGFQAEGLQGDLEQQDRDKVMAKFRNHSTRILVATDVAARGIDVADLELVINFDVPQPDIYTHRVGRTGRAGKSGVAITFVSPKERHRASLLEKENPLTVGELPGRTDMESTGEKLAPPKMVTFYISGGRKDKVRPGDILGALTGDAGGFNGADVGKIEIHDRFSYVAVSRSIATAALKCLQDGKIKGRKFRVDLLR